jgi:GTP-binding protein HflX
MAPATYLGRGKAEVLAQLRRATGAELVVVCNKLSSSQMRNLEQIIGCPVLDLGALGAARTQTSR